MGLLDFHAKNLLPSVWSPDGDPTKRFLAQLGEQLKRFPETKTVLLVGDAVSHYWQPDSDVDVLLLTPEESLPDARGQSERASGYPLAETENHVNFWPIREHFAPGVLAKHFGPVYNVSTGAWYGQRVQDEMELQRTAGVLQYANWRLWKAKYLEDPFPYDWRILAEAFQRLDENDRMAVVDTIKYRVSQIDRNVTKLLRHQSKDVWRAAEVFDQELVETEELPQNAGQIPRRIALALLHRFRYQDLLETLVEIDEKLQYRAQLMARYGAPKSLDTKSIKTLMTRLLQLVDLVIQQLGGSSRSADIVTEMIEQILTHSRYVLTDQRRRQIAYRLYRTYYMGRGVQEEGKPR